MRRLLALAVALVVLPACGGKLFRNDHRIEILQPRKYATVDQPLTVRWQAKDFAAPDDGHFLVLVDRDPMPPGETLTYFRRNRLDIYQVDATTFTVDVFTPHVGANSTERNRHDVTVVLLDRDGRRIGESAGFVEFTVRRPD